MLPFSLSFIYGRFDLRQFHAPVLALLQVVGHQCAAIQRYRRRIQGILWDGHQDSIVLVAYKGVKAGPDRNAGAVRQEDVLWSGV